MPIGGRAGLMTFLWLVLLLWGLLGADAAEQCSPAEKLKIQHELRRFVERGSPGYFLKVDPKTMTAADRARLGPCRLPFVGLTTAAALVSSDCLANGRGATPLHLAISEGKSRAAEALEEAIHQHRADIDKRNTAGLTPLMLAAKLGNDALVKLLLQSNAQVGLVCEQGGAPFTALSFAAAESHLATHVCHQGRIARYGEVAELLIGAGASPETAAGAKGLPPLLLAASTGSASVALALLAAGASPDAKGDRGKSALHYAAERGDVELVRALLKRHAAVNAATSDGQTPLHLAAKVVHAHSAEVIKLLVEAGAKLEQRAGKMGMNALVFATIAGAERAVAQLLRSGSDAKAATSDGVTALMWASQAGGARVVADLLKHGADPNVRTHAGATALDIALHGGHTDSARVLRAVTRLPLSVGIGSSVPTSVAVQAGAAGCVLIVLFGMMKVMRSQRTVKAGDLQL